LPQFENHKNYNIKITTDSGEEYLVYANWLHNNQLDNWQGWSCEAGASRLLIDKDLKVYSGECKNDYLGSAIDGFELLDHAICKQTRCTGCTDDLSIEKSNIFSTLI
jgi:hypothetical protein